MIPRHAPSSNRTVRAASQTRRERAGVGDDAGFLLAWLKSPLRTGAVTSSSRSLAVAMAAEADPEKPGPIVELGPGTGPMTRALLDRGFDEDRLILIEFNGEFHATLSERYPRATVIRGDAYAMRGLVETCNAGPLNAVVSSLPLLTKPIRERQHLVRDALALSADHGRFVQFTYGSRSPVPVAGTDFEARQSRRIWWNLPPAAVWVYTKAL